MNGLGYAQRKVLEFKRDRMLLLFARMGAAAVFFTLAAKLYGLF